MVCPQILWGQTYFNMRYLPETGTWGSWSSGIVVKDSSYYMNRSGVSYSVNKRKFFTSKIDSNGLGLVVLDSLYFDSLEMTMAGLTSSEKGFLDISSIVHFNPVEQQYGIVKYDETGQIIFHKIDSTKQLYIYMTEIVELEDQSSIAVGTTQAVNGSRNNEKIVLIKSDSLGNQLWRKEYRFGSLGHNGMSVASCFDGGYVIGGAEVNYNFVTPNADEFVKPIVIKLDSLGNIEWRKEYGSDTLSNSPAYGIIQTQDEGFVFVGGIGVSGTTNRAKQIPWIVKLDSIGEVIWERKSENINTRPSTGFTNFLDIEELPDGALVACGAQQFLFDDKPTTDKYRTRGVISKYNSNGQLKWLRDYVHPETQDTPLSLNVLYDIEQTSGGGFVAIGTLSPSTDTTQDTWVIKVDSFGCLEPGCEVIGVPEIAQTIETLKIYPNPSKGILHIEITPGIQKTKNDTYEFQLYDMLGKRVFQTNLEPQMNTISVSDLPTGVYTYRLGTVRGMVVLD